MTDRKYVAISIKHSTYDESPVPILWGKKRTLDNEERCFSGYTQDINKCELYSLEDFQKSYGNGCIKCDAEVKMCFNYKRKYKKYDTVLVDFEELKQFLSFVEG
ncbi:MAG: hypothetical protein RR115_07675 [Hydrogenoanaerobacterium sp.]